MEEANEIIGIAQAMGMIEPKIASSLPNATKCTNLLDIEKSQKKDEILLIFEQIKGMLMFWGLGMVLASIVFVVENAMRPIRKEKIRSKFTGVIQNCMQVNEREIHFTEDQEHRANIGGSYVIESWIE